MNREPRTSFLAFKTQASVRAAIQAKAEAEGRTTSDVLHRMALAALGRGRRIARAGK